MEVWSNGALKLWTGEAGPLKPNSHFSKQNYLEEASPICGECRVRGWGGTTSAGSFGRDFFDFPSGSRHARKREALLSRIRTSKPFRSSRHARKREALHECEVRIYRCFGKLVGPRACARAAPGNL